MITNLDQVTAWPLCWPENRPRASQRITSAFKVATLPTAQRLVISELARYRALRYMISQAPPYMKNADPASAVWFEMRPKKSGAPPELRVLACDKFIKPGENLYAIGRTLEALRAVERYGSYSLEQAVEGARIALPPPGEEILWWDILAIDRSWPLAAVEMAYRTKAEKAHPDRGGTVEEMARLNEAIAAARKEKGSR